MTAEKKISILAASLCSFVLLGYDYFSIISIWFSFHKKIPPGKWLTMLTEVPPPCTNGSGGYLMQLCVKDENKVMDQYKKLWNLHEYYDRNNFEIYRSQPNKIALQFRL
jgi:hypothetical protein